MKIWKMLKKEKRWKIVKNEIFGINEKLYNGQTIEVEKAFNLNNSKRCFAATT